MLELNRRKLDYDLNVELTQHWKLIDEPTARTPDSAITAVTGGYEPKQHEQLVETAVSPMQLLTQTDQQPGLQRMSSSHVSVLRKELFRTFFPILFQILQAAVAAATALGAREWTTKTINGNVRDRTANIDDEDVDKDNLVVVNGR